MPEASFSIWFEKQPTGNIGALSNEGFKHVTGWLIKHIHRIFFTWKVFAFSFDLSEMNAYSMFHE